MSRIFFKNFWMFGKGIFSKPHRDIFQIRVFCRVVLWKTRIFCSKDENSISESVHGPASVGCSRSELPLCMDSQYDVPPGDDLTRPPVAELVVNRTVPSPFARASQLDSGKVKRGPSLVFPIPSLVIARGLSVNFNVSRVPLVTSRAFALATTRRQINSGNSPATLVWNSSVIHTTIDRLGFWNAFVPDSRSSCT
jgi:hypothetical protein